MEIRVEKTLFAVIVYINDLPHLHLRLDGYRGMYSYIEGYGPPRKWFIEFYYVGMEPIVAEYDAVDRWVEVLKALAPYLK